MEGMTCDGQKCSCGADATKDVNGTCMCEACAGKMGGDTPVEPVVETPAEVAPEAPVEESTPEAPVEVAPEAPAEESMEE